MHLNAEVVVIGAGIVGNCVAYHLTKNGWKDILLLDKGPLPNPGGSTGHASNFIFPLDHSKEMTLLTLDSMRQYKELGVFTESGGIEVARTEERMEELRRRMASAKAWGVEAELITTGEVKKLVPFINSDLLLGGFWSPTVGVVDSLRAGTLMREESQALGALKILPTTEIVDIEVEHGRVKGIKTNKGDIRTEYVVIACGVWSPRIARMAGTTIPLTPAVHQMISVGPIPLFEKTVGEIEYPIVRDMDTFMYERQNGSDIEIGSYAHRPILHDPDDIPSIEEAALSPTELPFTQDDFDPQMEQALDLMPDILDDGTGRHPSRCQRAALVDPGRGAHPRRDGRGQRPLVRCRSVDQGRPRGRTGCCRVDDHRSAGNRPAHLGCRPLLRLRPIQSAYPRPHLRGVQQDLRNHPPGGTMGVEPKRPGQPLLHA